ncbi:MAG: hypothetical protein IKV88_01865 [Clostridia bacterium]|nr:hypothetical protein [Clostridia bacterium]
MRKLISVVLCLMLIISCLPLTGFSAENIAEKPAETQNAETLKKPTDDGYVKFMREEAKMKKELSLIEKEQANESDEVVESDGDFELMASTGTMKVKVTFPTGTTTKNGDVVYVYLYTPPVINGGKVESEAVWYKSKSATLTGDVDSVTVSLTSVAYGNYIVCAKLRAGNKNVLSNMQYYSSSGTVISEFSAEKVKLSASSKTVTLPLLKSESSISGTIDLSSCVPTADTTINVSSCIEEGVFYNYQYIDIPVKAGTKSVKYEMGLSDGSQYVRFSSAVFKSGYYYDGYVNNSWKYRTYFNLKSQHKTGLDVVVSPKSSGVAADYNISLKLPYTPEYVELFCGLTDGYDIVAEQWVSFDNANTVEIGLTPDFECDELYFFYKEVNPYDGADYLIDESMRFYSEDRGITGNIEYATDITDMNDITVEYPDTYTISGDINTETGLACNTYVYVGVEFEDDIFYTYVSESEGTYKIYVPKSFKNREYTVFTAMGSYGCMLSDTKEYGKTYTLSGNKTGVNITTHGAREISGVIELPCETPKSGLVITIDYYSETDDGVVNYGYAGTCYIAPGETSADYSVLVPAYISPYLGDLEARAESSEKINISQMAYSMSLEDNEDIYFDETVTLSGKIILPDTQSTLSSSLTVEVHANYSYGWAYGYTTILAGESYAQYSLQIAKDSTIRILEIVHQRDDIAIDRSYYYSPAGTLVPSWTELRVFVDDDMEIDFKYPESVMITGTISLPDDAFYSGGKVSYGIYCESVESGIQYSKHYSTETPYEDNDFSISVTEQDAEYIIYVYVDDIGDSSILQYEWCYYVSDSAMTLSKEDATRVSADEKVKLAFPVCDTISGTVNFSEGCKIDSGSVDIVVYAFNANFKNYYYSWYEDINTTEPFDYRIDVPSGDDEKYIVYTYVTYDDENTVTNIERYVDSYYTSDGMVKTEEEAEKIAPSSDINLTISKYREITGKIIVPADYKYVNPLSEIDVVLADEDNYTYYYRGKVDENLNFAAYITDNYIENGDYTVYVIVEDSQQNNILKDKNYFYVDSNGNNKTVSVTDSGDITGVKVKVETGWSISGTVYVPDDAVRENAIIDVRVLGHLDYWYGGNVGEIGPDDNSIDYMIAVEKETASFPVWACAEVYEYDDDLPYSANISEDYVYYASKTASTLDLSKASNVVVNGNVSGIDIYLQTGAVFEVGINYPSFANGSLSGYVYLVDETGNEAGYRSFYISEYDSQARLNMVISKDYVGKNLYLCVECDSYNDDPIYRSKVYINPDGSLAFGRNSATPFTIGLTNEVSYTPIKDDDSRIPTYSIESKHPYESNTNETYTYNHPDSSVSKLYVTFNEASELSSGDYIQIYDTNDNYVCRFGPYDNLSSRTFVVNDSGFKIVFESNSYSESYGFAIESITTEKTHTVVFKNYDGTVLKTYTVNHGDSIYYDGPEPTKPAKPMHICTFEGWDEYTGYVESDMVVTAQFYEDAMYYIYFAGSEWLNEDPYNVYVENCTGEDRKACYVVANYDAKGKLVDVSLEEIDFYAYNNPIRNTGKPICDGGYVKVMLLDSITNLLPIAQCDIAR